MKRLGFLMGTVIQIEVIDQNLEYAADVAIEEIARVEQLMSRFLPSSDVARINAGRGRPVSVSPETFYVIERSLDISLLSNGAFDITLGSRNGANFHDVILDRETLQVILCKPGLSIDLGGIAKGYAVDRAIDILNSLGVRNALVNAGGDIRGLGQKAPGEDWSVGVQHPRAQDALLCRLPLSQDRAVATSGDYYRYHVRNGRKYGHISDPRLGEHVRPCLTTTVVADRALEADALATAAFVLGPDKGMCLIERLPGVEALLVGEDGNMNYTAGMRAIWDEPPRYKVINSPPELRRHHSSGFIQKLAPLGALTLTALALGCQAGTDIQPTPAYTQPAPTITPESRLYIDGSYRGSSLSGVAVKVEVTVQGGRISDIQVLEYREISSVHVGTPTKNEEEWRTNNEEVLRIIPERIIEKQSAAVDVVTGATMSSKTIMEAVEDALLQAVS